MTVGENVTERSATAKRRARHLRIAAVIVLLLGAMLTAMVYWRGRRQVDLSQDPSMLAYDKSQARQMEMYYGKQGLVLNQLLESLKKPNTQAIVILAAAGLVAVGCFYVARLVEIDGETPEMTKD